MKQSTVTSSGADHGTYASYIIGFVLSILLTIIPYYIVVYLDISTGFKTLSIVILAVAQLLVQLIFFLHLNTRSEKGWNFLSFVFTMLVVLILIGGSLWIMYHLRANMML
ncbi:cytochrome o ubiquinol oxidase subunit IV [Shewanella surugensis]|uniref:Cytochrome bo(3) ubiquinol oxidase subunit 4 n=1 Tax=Shewanella surugensis TaxID=212020 RepID=A0ABT0LC46_9GAMM|nr:cytochrome o ubiquinol oxidase subunit IV [Shewanella surugensis]MCL1125258.1 cytochrome o ubiquinol oxidase subunit IV [Shewanella surugensis]